MLTSNGSLEGKGWPLEVRSCGSFGLYVKQEGSADYYRKLYSAFCTVMKRF